MGLASYMCRLESISRSCDCYTVISNLCTWRRVCLRCNLHLIELHRTTQSDFILYEVVIVEARTSVGQSSRIAVFDQRKDCFLRELKGYIKIYNAEDYLRRTICGIFVVYIIGN